MNNTNQKILVAGATGTTGNLIIDLLEKSNNYTPIAMVRKEEQREHFENRNINTVLADLEKDVSYAAENADKVIFAAGSGGEKVETVDRDGAKKLIDSARDKNCSKFVMLSSMGADDPSQNEELREYLEAKQQADEYLRSSGIKYSIVRPGRLKNEPAAHQIKLEEHLNEQGEISRADVAKTLVTALDDGIRQNKTFEIIEGNTSIESALK